MSTAHWYYTGRKQGSGITPFPAEVGRIKRNDRYLVNEVTGQTWFGRGLTEFMLYPRFLRGENVEPIITWARSMGANYLRVFGPVAADRWPDWTDYAAPDPTLFRKLREFAELLAFHGMRMEFVPICGPWSEPSAITLLDTAYAQLSGCWNVFIEATNEPGQPATYSHNLHTLIDGVNKRGILTATGVAAIPPDPVAQLLLGIPHVTSFTQMHWTDYATGHFNDTQNNRYPRVSKAARDWRDGDAEVGMPGNNLPTWLDEDERADDGQGYPSLEDHVSHNAVGCIFSGAQLVHFNAGKFGQVASPGGFEEQVIMETARLWMFIPPEAQHGSYTRPPWNDFPLVWTDADSTVQHAYCSWVGNVGWCVNCLPPPGWKAVAKPGFQILEVGPRPWILKVGR